MIENMIRCDPNKRPDAHSIAYHIFFWPNDKKLKML